MCIREGLISTEKCDVEKKKIVIEFMVLFVRK